MSVIINGTTGITTNTGLLKATIVEYASNSGGEGTAANTSYSNIAYNSTSSAGSVIPAVTISSTTATTMTAYYCYFTTACAAGDIVRLELSISNNVWIDASVLPGDSMAVGFSYGSIKIGVDSLGISVGSNVVLMRFSNAGRLTSGTWGLGAENWGSVNSLGWRYRFVKYSFL